MIRAQNLIFDYPIINAEHKSLRHALMKGRIFSGKSGIVKVRSINDMSFTINEGERVGLLGRNGAGKTTLLKLLAKIYYPSGGLLQVEGTINSMLNHSAGIHNDATGREVIYLCGVNNGFSLPQIKSMEADIVKCTDIGDFIDLPISTYSLGMNTRLSFAIATSVKPDILILDEILSAGDADFQLRARERFAAVMAQSRIIVLASHSEATIKDNCTRAILIENGTILFDGDPHHAIAEYQSLTKITYNQLFSDEKPTNYFQELEDDDNEDIQPEMMELTIQEFENNTDEAPVLENNTDEAPVQENNTDEAPVQEVIPHEAPVQENNTDEAPVQEVIIEKKIYYLTLKTLSDDIIAKIYAHKDLNQAPETIQEIHKKIPWKLYFPKISKIKKLEICLGILAMAVVYYSKNSDKDDIIYGYDNLIQAKGFNTFGFCLLHAHLMKTDMRIFNLENNTIFNVMDCHTTDIIFDSQKGIFAIGSMDDLLSGKPFDKDNIFMLSRENQQEITAHHFISGQFKPSSLLFSIKNIDEFMQLKNQDLKFLTPLGNKFHDEFHNANHIKKSGYFCFDAKANKIFDKS